MKRDEMQTRVTRNIADNFRAVEENDNSVIEGYFAVFGDVYDMGGGMSEEIAPGAFSHTLDNDIRALINHNDTLVLGRTKSGTLELKEDDHGLWGRVKINPNDSDAMNLYARVQRGDVDGCSIGFNIRSEDTDIRDDGGVHWTIKDIDLAEVTVASWPAYTETNVIARSKQKADLEKRKAEAWKTKMQNRLKNGEESEEK